ncbi:MAG: GntR family transcriptional regulator, partial [Brucella intermedia]
MEETNVRDRLTRSPANMPLATMDSWGSESLAEQAYRILERSIVTLELEPRSVVNE